MSRILHITQEGYDQAFGRVNQVPMYELADQRRRQEIGSRPMMIELEIRRHLPTSAYEVFVQRRMDRDSYMARITHEGQIVAEVDVTNLILRARDQCAWRTQLCLNLSRDITARGR